MEPFCFFTAGNTPALQYAAKVLENRGYIFTSVPGRSVTHLLLPVPSFDENGQIIGGSRLEDVLSSLNSSITVLGGKLSSPILSQFSKIDLLEDSFYLAENASITAYCAVNLAATHLPIILKNASILVVGWGRIGKCLAHILQQVGSTVTVAARKESDRAILSAIGYNNADTENLDPSRYNVVFNTVPHMILPHAHNGPLYIDLASKPGMHGDHVLWARGLPGKYAPESSGQLIADTVQRLIKKEEKP